MAAVDQTSSNVLSQISDTTCDWSGKVVLLERECDLLKQTTQILEDRIADLETKNFELTQANVSLLEENKALKIEIDKTIKECLIKVVAGRREHKQFEQDLDQHILKMEEAKAVLDQSLICLKHAKSNYDPLYIFNHQFEDSLTFEGLERLNSNRLKSLPHKENTPRPGAAPKESIQPNLEAVTEETHSMTRGGNQTPSYQRFDPKSMATPGLERSNLLQDTNKSWVYNSPLPPSKTVYFHDSIDSIQNFEAKSMLEESSRSMFRSIYRSTPKPPPKDKTPARKVKPPRKETKVTKVSKVKVVLEEDDAPVRRSARPKKKVSYKI